MRYLAMILFLPWFAILGFAYWRLAPRHGARRGYDLLAVLVALVGAAWVADLAVHSEWPQAGRIWPQVLAGLLAYAAYSVLIGGALLLRRWLWSAPKPLPADSD
jgi:uncharacterized membrane protein